jgi:hypothetical protein
MQHSGRARRSAITALPRSPRAPATVPFHGREADQLATYLQLWSALMRLLACGPAEQGYLRKAAIEQALAEERDLTYPLAP